MFYFLSKTIRNGRYIIRTPSSIHKLGLLQNPFVSSKYISTPSKQQSFAVSYLINKLGFSPEVALSASRYVSFKNPKKADTVVEFFKCHGFSPTQISDLVRRFPGVLVSKPTKTLLPKIEFFTSKGISNPDLAKMFSGSPSLFKRSLEKQIIPAFSYFKDLLQSDDKTLQAIKRFSGMLVYNIETHVAPNIDILKENGVPDSSICTLLEYQPRAFMVSPVRFREIVDEVKEMGFNPSRMKFALAVFAFRSMTKSTWKSKVEAYKKWGWSEDEIYVAFERHPWCMMASTDKITRVMDFFVNTMGFDSMVVFRRPALVSLSVEKRLIPRGLIIKVLLSKGLAKLIPRGLIINVLLSKGLVSKEANISALFGTPDKKFLQRFVMPHKEEAPELLKLYKENFGSLEIRKEPDGLKAKQMG